MFQFPAEFAHEKLTYFLNLYRLANLKYISENQHFITIYWKTRF